MSIERACVNCERCYHLAEKIMDFVPYDNDQMYAARNEAMKSLETVSVGYNEAVSLTERKDTNDSIIAKKALQACRSCDYSAPKIVETVENLSKEKE